ncbi:unnamed protein product, partial [Mesorhabditis belari]|uniref:Uncharacterized protein n=1 Tax=Mesorhabditis belari TaxID=2138241 RepID=A0AAF3EIJ8_9BILA
MPHKNLQKRNSSGVNRSASTVDVVALEKAYGNSTSDTHSDVDENAVHWRGEETVNDQCVTGSKLINGAKSGDLPTLLVSLFAGADVNSFVDGTTPLHIAIKMGNATVVEFLLLNGAKITLADAHGDTALHIAAREGRTLEACLLMKRGADKDLINSRGETPMQIAIDGKHADIVTLFRIHKMRDELSEEFDNPMNKTVEEIINDITKGATKAATLR